MATGISKRVFGADLHPRVRQKLELRQALAEQSQVGDSIELDDALFDNEGVPKADVYSTNFGGVLDCKSPNTCVHFIYLLLTQEQPKLFISLKSSHLLTHLTSKKRL